MKENLYNTLKKAKLGDKESTLDIIVKFTPLIKKYSRKLKYDGAETDLIIALIEIIRKSPTITNLKSENIIVSYISKSIINEYIRLSKKYTRIYKMEICMDENIICDNTINNIESCIFIEELLDNLTWLQRHILISIYFYDRTEQEIANKLNISKQAVNRAKWRALNKLHNYCKVA